jgi:hypothetical protein
MDVILTIDTEADDQWDHSQTELTTANLEFIPRFQDLCNRFDFKPTYLCTWEVVEDPRFESLRAYQEAGVAEIGAHLHPWTTPPLEHPQNGIDRDAFGAYPCELEPAILNTKLRSLTERIQDRAGVRPRSYRAGRWGFGAEQVSSLISLGYLVDCSVTPLVSWAHVRGAVEGGPDFRTAPAAPYFLDPNDVCMAGGSELLEVPVTILFTNQSLARSSGLRDLYSRYSRTLPVRAVNKVVRLAPQWFRPYSSMSYERLKAVYERARRAGLPAVEMMFHSSELMPGGSPYNRDQAAVEDLYQRLERLFSHLRDEGCRGTTLSGFAEDYAGRIRPSVGLPRA